MAARVDYALIALVLAIPIAVACGFLQDVMSAIGSGALAVIALEAYLVIDP